MKKRRKGVIVFVLLILIAAGVGIYFYLNKDKDNVLGDIVDVFTKDEKDIDNRNGFYIYEEKLDKSVKVSSSCTIVSYKYYLSVVNKKWFLYKDTCLGVYQLETGKTEDLKINYDSESKEYSLKYDGNLYVKNDNLRSVVPVATFENTDSHKIQLDGYKMVVKETMTDSYHYRIERPIVGAYGYIMVIEYKNGAYEVEISSIVTVEETNDVEKYIYRASNIDDLPDFSLMNGKIVIIEKYNINNRTNYDLKLFTYQEAQVYSLKEVFPITLNGISLSPETHNIFVSYDNVKKSYVMLVSENKDFCVKDSKENKVAYYEFRIDVDYNDYTFKTPTFVRTWYERDGCSHFNGLKEE